MAFWQRRVGTRGYGKGIHGVSAMTLLVAGGMLGSVGCGNQRRADEVGSQAHDRRPDGAVPTAASRDAGDSLSSGSATSAPTDGDAGEIPTHLSEPITREAGSDAHDGGFGGSAPNTNLPI